MSEFLLPALTRHMAPNYIHVIRSEARMNSVFLTAAFIEVAIMIVSD